MSYFFTVLLLHSRLKTVQNRKIVKIHVYLSPPKKKVHPDPATHILSASRFPHSLTCPVFHTLRQTIHVEATTQCFPRVNYSYDSSAYALIFRCYLNICHWFWRSKLEYEMAEAKGFVFVC